MINKGGMNQEYVHLILGTIQGATIAGGAFDMRLFNSNGQWQVPEALLLTNYRSIAGDWFGEAGCRVGIQNDPRSWFHPTANGGSDSCFVIYGSNSTNNYLNTINYLKNNFYLYEGYSIKSYLFDDTPYAWSGFGYKRGAW